jgi:hypothetical protein
LDLDPPQILEITKNADPTSLFLSDKPKGGEQPISKLLGFSLQSLNIKYVVLRTAYAISILIPIDMETCYILHTSLMTIFPGEASPIVPIVRLQVHIQVPQERRPRSSVLGRRPKKIQLTFTGVQKTERSLGSVTQSFAVMGRKECATTACR